MSQRLFHAPGFVLTASVRVRRVTFSSSQRTQLHWSWFDNSGIGPAPRLCFARFPLAPALSLGERVKRFPPGAHSTPLRFPPRVARCSLSPRERDRVRGNRSTEGPGGYTCLLAVVPSLSPHPGPLSQGEGATSTEFWRIDCAGLLGCCSGHQARLPQ